MFLCKLKFKTFFTISCLWRDQEADPKFPIRNSSSRLQIQDLGPRHLIVVRFGIEECSTGTVHTVRYRTGMLKLNRISPSVRYPTDCLDLKSRFGLKDSDPQLFLSDTDLNDQKI